MWAMLHRLILFLLYPNIVLNKWNCIVKWNIFLCLVIKNTMHFFQSLTMLYCESQGSNYTHYPGNINQKSAYVDDRSEFYTIYTLTRCLFPVLVNCCSSSGNSSHFCHCSLILLLKGLLRATSSGWTKDVHPAGTSNDREFADLSTAATWTK